MTWPTAGFSCERHLLPQWALCRIHPFGLQIVACFDLTRIFSRETRFLMKIHKQDNICS
jgi:hypothetical protein